MELTEIIKAIGSLPESELQYIKKSVFNREHPVANILPNGTMVCSKCNHHALPKFGETGYELKHFMDSLEVFQDGTVSVIASGGSGSDFTDDGEEYVFYCAHCYQGHRVPDKFELDWQ